MKLDDLFLKIRKEPGLFIGRETLTGLAHFIDGYVEAQLEHGEYDSSLLKELDEFVRHRYAMDGTHRWSSVILFFEQDESRAFRRFYQLLDELLQKKDRKEVLRPRSS